MSSPNILIRGVYISLIASSRPPLGNDKSTNDVGGVGPTHCSPSHITKDDRNPTIENSVSSSKEFISPIFISSDSVWGVGDSLVNLAIDHDPMDQWRLGVKGESTYSSDLQS